MARHSLRLILNMIALLLTFACTKQEKPSPQAFSINNQTNLISEEVIGHVLSDQELGGCYQNNCQIRIYNIQYSLIYIPSQNIYEINKSDNPVAYIQLVKKESDEAEKVFLNSFANSLIVTYEAGNFNEIYSEVVAYDLRTFEEKWRLTIPRFNLSRPLQKENLLFVSAIGFIGSVDLTHGSWKWKQEKLYETMGYQGANSISININMVLFRYDQQVLKADIQTGQIKP